MRKVSSNSAKQSKIRWVRYLLRMSLGIFGNFVRLFLPKTLKRQRKRISWKKKSRVPKRTPLLYLTGIGHLALRLLLVISCQQTRCTKTSTQVKVSRCGLKPNCTTTVRKSNIICRSTTPGSLKRSTAITRA